MSDIYNEVESPKEGNREERRAAERYARLHHVDYRTALNKIREINYKSHTMRRTSSNGRK